MQVLIASDSFKGSLSSAQVVEAGRMAAARVDRHIEVTGLPIADGGEGTVDCVLQAVEGRRISVKTVDPLGRPITADLAVVGQTAIVELASASGLTILSPAERNPYQTSTYGTGLLIRYALDLPEVREILVAIGGSATNDGGLGMAQALGLKAWDVNGRPVKRGGQHVGEVAKLDTSEMHPRLKEVMIRVACDVDNPLYGENGASHVFGPQKGATPEMVKTLDANLRRLSDVIRRDLGVDVSRLPGGGAAGGTGAGLAAFCGARLEPGIELLLDVCRFDERMKEVDLVITGEGRTDHQTLRGKAPVGVAKRAKRYGKPVICVSGAYDPAMVKELRACGIDAVFSLCPGPTDEEKAFAHAFEWMVSTLENVFGLLLGMKGDKR
ncbi:glycerate kinase [Polycladomyces subterraneus]|uniref:Glycerate kinase n=1 Tax=Polycladomyces subterraneus TaxID=1016997 RepID=A0ABT8IQW5_9BACL|nr:glycerate kinase [Polycladomyces subterraneus]MDN4594494.1 glycerate kinase [Polycladomyces subterraneus]